MTARSAFLLGAAALATCSDPAQGGKPPPRVSACSVARLVAVGPRLEGIADSGVAATYSNKLHQVSYDPIPGLQASRPGDRVRLCVVSRPKGCPPGDARGAVYSATNLRTGQRWKAADSSHRCGGA